MSTYSVSTRPLPGGRRRHQAQTGSRTSAQWFRRRPAASVRMVRLRLRLPVLGRSRDWSRPTRSASGPSSSRPSCVWHARRRFLGSAGPALRRVARHGSSCRIFLTLWEAATAKFAWLPLPFFPPPQAILEVYTDDSAKAARQRVRVGETQLGGYIIGPRLAFLTGVSIGWSQKIGYWVHPVLRSSVRWPLPGCRSPSSLSSSWSASTFLIALATGFPVTVLTWSRRRQREQCLLRRGAHAGAKPSFLVLKVAIPRRCRMSSSVCSWALAHVPALVIAEMIGVKAGSAGTCNGRRAGRPTPTCTRP